MTGGKAHLPLVDWPKGPHLQRPAGKGDRSTGLADGVDLIVATTPISASVTKPVIKGLAFLTGIGKDKVLDEIEAELRK